MLDVKFIRENKEKVMQGVASKGVEIDIEKLLALDEKRIALLKEVEELNAQKNQLNNAFKDSTKKDAAIEEGKKVKERLAELEPQYKEVEDEFKSLMYQLPNLAFDHLPEGGEENNTVIKKVGEIRDLGFTPRDHVELGELLDIIDLPRAAKVSGARFAYLKNEGALLELALVQYAMNKLFDAGFKPILPPVLIKKEVTNSLGYWQGMADERHSANENYYLVKDSEEEGEKETENPLYLVGTGEHSVVPMHSGELLDESELPKKYAAFSSCFRREVGTGGKDIRGILRVHQFEKVEMVAFVTPDQDEKVRKEMLEMAESFVADLGLPYQVLQLAKGDISFPAAETIDIETWVPSQNMYRETHSISTTTDFQARRLKTRYKTKDGNNQLVHILNGTALALGRIIIAILENYQQEDGSVKIPDILVPYTRFSEIKLKR